MIHTLEEKTPRIAIQRFFISKLIFITGLGILWPGT